MKPIVIREPTSSSRFGPIPLKCDCCLKEKSPLAKIQEDGEFEGAMLCAECLKEAYRLLLNEGGPVL